MDKDQAGSARSLVLLLSAWLAFSLSACASPKGPIYTASVYIKADYDAVWRSFTEAEAFAAWYTVPCREFGLEPGDELIWADGERVVYRGRMLRAEYGQGLAWEFRFEGFDFDEPMRTLEIDITESGETVLVVLRHRLNRAPHTAKMISPIGWTKPISRLKTLLETGTAMPWPG
ncbi:MAG: hypothetical protein ACI8QC_002485 [Planctomycetota bacterium]|jgi:uncharacterized protein YndB with AHSA1/START domain